MDTTEFSARLIRILNEKELRETLKKSIAQGFSVQGFKNPWKAPRSTIIKCMEQKDRDGKYYYMTILEIISSLVDSENDNEISSSSLVKQWLNNNKILNEKIENDLTILEDKYKAYNTKKEQIVSNDSIKEVNVLHQNKLGQANRILQEKNIALQEKNKTLQSTIQSNKIEISNLEKVISKLQKENQKLDKEFNKTKIDMDTYNIHKVETRQKLNESNKYNLLLLDQIEELKKYKECAPKIICFIKTRVQDSDFGGYDITYVKEWNDNYKENLENNQYDEIWIIHTGFSYSDITEIKTYASCKVKEFLNITQLKNKMEEKDEYNR